jgi:sulfite dehydrogenase
VNSNQPKPTRRELLKALGAMATTALTVPAMGAHATARATVVGHTVLPFQNGERDLVAFPQKRPLIVLTSRPPQLETPFSVFNDGPLTPNDAFFVRYHWSGIPTSVDAQSYRLRVTGKVNVPVEFSLNELKQLAEPMEFIAVNQCSGNSRGYFTPRVNGGQLSNGAMGNARWTGVPLRKVLEKAGIQAGAVQVSFGGLDRPPLEASPGFVKALAIEHALDGEVMLAWAMNGKDLPMLNGYPVRLVVPGHYGTYWVKHLSDINVLDKAYDGFWMSRAYRIPDNPCACMEPGSVPATTIPINRFNIRSFVTSLTDGGKVPVGANTTVQGIAFDGGYGISKVAFSADDGRSWVDARLGKDLGKYSFRTWTVPFKPATRGLYSIKVRAVNRAGETQPMNATWNPAGYMRNVVETMNVSAV